VEKYSFSPGRGGWQRAKQQLEVWVSRVAPDLIWDILGYSPRENARFFTGDAGCPAL